MTATVTPIDWQASAACADADPYLFTGPDLFAGEEPHMEQEAREAKAKAVCAGCPVRAQCLSSALRNGGEHGVWGGTSESDRQPETGTGQRPPLYCAQGKHPRTQAGTAPNGECRDCKREYRQRTRPPSGLGKGRTAEPRARGKNGRFASPADREQAA